MAQASKKNQADQTDTGADATKQTPPDPDQALRDQILAGLKGAGLPEATVARMIETAVREAKANREAEAIKAQISDIEKAIAKALAPVAKDLRTAMDLGYELGFGNLSITVPVDEKGDRKPGTFVASLVSPVGVRRTPQGGGGGVARSGEQWTVSGPGVNETLGSPSTAAQKVQEAVTGKSSSTNGRAWWGIPQDAPIGHKVTKTYKGSLFTITRVG